MPSAPRKICLKTGCGVLVNGNGSFCEKHTLTRQIQKQTAAKRYDAERGTKSERGYTAQWSRYSVAYRKANPLCVHCLKTGKLTSVEGRGGCVDHIKPVTGPGDPDFWNPANHQPLCISCHSLKTSIEDGGYGNRKER